ncbi:MAG: GNAT superfamily N-acetyltransferase [Flavobacteriales bacterium]|jgi:GNAT superfamily N-acetyltransferase
MQVQVLSDVNSTLRKTFAVFQQLRPHLTEDDFLARVDEQFCQGYRIAYISQDDVIVAVMGFRVNSYLAWGNIFYIDDLATCSTALRKGYAGRLLDWAEGEARTQDCDQIHLDSGYMRSDAHRLYLNKGFSLVSHHFSKKIQ